MLRLSEEELHVDEYGILMAPEGTELSVSVQLLHRLMMKVERT